MILFLLATDTMGLPFHSLLADACDNDELGVDDCWAAETNSDCVTSSSTDGHSDGPETAVEPIARPAAEQVAKPVPEQVAEPVLHQVLKPFAEPVPEPIP